MRPVGLPHGWTHISERLPSEASVVVGLQLWDDSNPFYRRVLVQYVRGVWSYVGSDQQCRDVVAWANTPPLPVRGVRIPT